MSEGKGIVPWFIGDDGAVDRVARVLEQRGVFASAIRFPAVARGEAIVRFMPMASHSGGHIERALEACGAPQQQRGFAPDLEPSDDTATLEPGLVSNGASGQPALLGR